MRLKEDDSELMSGKRSTRSRAVWPWALVSCLLVIVVVGGAAFAHQIASRIRRGEATVAAPAIRPLAIVGVSPPNTQLVGLDSGNNHLVALVSASMPVCPPVGNCPPAPALTAFLVLDGSTGAPLARTPLTGPAATVAGSTLLLVDSSRHLAYAVSAQSVTIFSTATGQFVASFALPSDIVGKRLVGGVVDVVQNLLVLATSDTAVVLDARSGSLLASHVFTGAVIEGPVLDDARSVVLFLADGDTLSAFDDRSLSALGTVALSFPAHLGPLNAASGTLYLTASRGACQYDVRALLDGPSAANVATSVATSSRSLCLSTAFGWDGSGTLVTTNGSEVALRDAASGSVVSALALPTAWPAIQPMLVNANLHLAYLLSLDGRVLFINTAANARALTPLTALALARSAMADLLPNTNQDPPFVAPETFPTGSGTRMYNFWIHFSDRGWQGPYPGSATTRMNTTPTPSGAYAVTFSITWRQLFQRTHTWVCEVWPNGSVRLVSSSGDALP